MNALKAVSRTDDQLIVENHIVLFGGRDLEGKLPGRNQTNADGSHGEFFSKATDLRSPYTNTGVLYVDWEHGYAGDPELKGAYDPGEPTYDDILGYVDWTTAKATNEGVLVRRILDRRNRFIQLIEPLIDEGLIGTSSAARGIEKAANGEITRYPLVRDTLTVMPMDPRMLSNNALVVVKSLAATWPAMKAAIVEDAPEQNQTATPAVEITEQPTNEVAQDDAPAVEPEKAPEPDNTELAALLTQFVTTITTILKG